MEDSNRFDLSIIVETAKRVITDPTEFYQSMAPTGGYGNPIVFVVVLGVAGGLIGSIWALFGAGPAAGFASGLASIIMLPVFMVIGSFIAGLILFVIWKLMGSTYGYETAYRCVAFSMAILPVVAVVGLIPYLGQILQTVWACWLMYIASIQVHKINAGTAKIVFAVLAALTLFSNVSTEYQARKIQKFAENFEEKMSAVNPLNEEMDSTEMGKAAAGFLTGLQEGSGGSALTSEQKAELEQAGAAMGKIMQSLQDTARDLESKNPEYITPQDAGAAMGALFKSLQEAAESMPGQQHISSSALAAQAPSVADIDIGELTSLGVIAKPSSAHAIGFSVNDNDRFAPVADTIKVYRDGEGIRYRIDLEDAYFREFTSLASNSASDSAAAAGANSSAPLPGQQNIVVNNAGLFVYDEDGQVVAGDECQQSVLQLGRETSAESSSGKREIWLWCPGSERSTMAP
ncbi:MAG: YIP1 family protein [Halioglobus sp.]